MNKMTATQFENTMKQTSDVDGDYRKYKHANAMFVFFDDLTDSQKQIAARNNLSFDAIGRVSNGDTLITKESFKLYE